MKQEKMKVLLYLKKSGLDKSGKAPIMGRITLGRNVAQFPRNNSGKLPERGLFTNEITPP